MIRVESITIKEFRGVRDLTLDFKVQNYAVCGPNGTGKSGVVDAIEFGLTGTISRLSGEGRGGVSVKAHAPHVDSRDAPDKARVTIKVAIPCLGKTATIERSVKTPTVLTVSPDESDIREVLQQIADHPEIVLSRRELIRYVLATPGKRAEEVQALLHLDNVENVRTVLQKIANAAERETKTLVGGATDARNNLLRALGITALDNDRILSVTNSQRAILGLGLLTELTESTSLKDGILTQASGPVSRIAKTPTLAMIKVAREELATLMGADVATDIAAAQAELEALESNPLVAVATTREDFYRTGLSLVEVEACPLCDTVWNSTALRNHLQDKLTRLQDITAKRMQAEATLAPIIRQLRKVKVAIEVLVPSGAQAAPPVAMLAAADYSAACTVAIASLTSFLPVARAMASLSSSVNVPVGVFTVLDSLERAVVALPEPTKQDAAREWLVVAQERLDVYREAVRRSTIAGEQAIAARKLSDLYMASSDAVLTDIYSRVEKDFAAMYAFINRDDENEFDAKLVPSLGSLGFDVDFYGRGFFPPGAYHSEGHQDGMGLCLYLALMRHLQGDDFTLAVLDDVVMSVDVSHRREVCSLLKKEFPHTQFILTTHDPIWLRHMKTEGLVRSRGSIVFRRWSVDQGPTCWDDRDTWTEIEDHLSNNDVRAAAALLRHYLEYISAELCSRLRARVELRGDAQYQLGDLLPTAIAQMRDIFAAAKRAASSWDQRPVVNALAAAEAQFSTLAEASRAEAWQVNAAIHFNTWENLTKHDFVPVAKVFRELVTGFTCVDCGDFLRITPDRQAREALRCECGLINMNLVAKA